jgi:hypothetical protein
MIFRMFLISLALLASLSKEPPAIPTLALTTPGSPHTVKGERITSFTLSRSSELSQSI